MRLRLGATLAACLVLGAARPSEPPGAAAAPAEPPPFSDELARQSTPAFSVMLPKTFRSTAQDPFQLWDGNRDSQWLWGVVAAQAGRFGKEELEKFAAGENCPKDKGQAVFHRKRVRTKAFVGVRISCGSPEGKPYGKNPHVSGWMRLQANSRRFDRRYTLHLDFWADPRDEEVQKLLDRVVLSFKEKGGSSTVPPAPASSADPMEMLKGLDLKGLGL